MIPFRSIYLDAPAVPGRILDIFEPTESSRGVALFFVHGGGWHAGSRISYHARGRRPHIAIIGTSAGAHLAAMAALTSPAQAPSYRITAVCLQATPFTFEPWTDIFPAIWGDMQRAIGTPYDSDPTRYRQASPISHIRPGQPPIFALHAEDEHMFPLDLTEHFATESRALGNTVEIKTYPRTEHGFFYNLDRWQQREAFDDILSFVERTAPC